ncbi:MAG: hypothetical protein QOI59_1932 [Gammaproteobacteria bacterium]|jgi:hypothetical protein|nr:hypothetical protein [Gammaproteobacteria bacterium]
MKRFLLAAALLTISWDAGAQAMQCGDRLVTQGDSISKVASLCGNPTQVDRTSIIRSVSGSFVNGQWLQSGGAQIEIPVEVWLYNLGPDRLMRQIRFEEGRVVKIETLDFGYLDKS